MKLLHLPVVVLLPLPLLLLPLVPLLLVLLLLLTKKMIRKRARVMTMMKLVVGWVVSLVMMMMVVGEVEWVVCSEMKKKIKFNSYTNKGEIDMI